MSLSLSQRHRVYCCGRPNVMLLAFPSELTMRSHHTIVTRLYFGFNFGNNFRCNSTRKGGTRLQAASRNVIPFSQFTSRWFGFTVKGNLFIEGTDPTHLHRQRPSHSHVLSYTDSHPRSHVQLHVRAPRPLHAHAYHVAYRQYL